MKKILIVLIVLIGIGWLSGVSEPKAEVKSYKHLVGFNYEYPQSLEFIEKHGYPETLKGTNGKTWVAYFPKSGFTATMNKKTMIINKIK